MCDICVNELTDEERASLPPLTRIRHGLTPYPQPTRVLGQRRASDRRAVVPGDEDNKTSMHEVQEGMG